MKGVEFNKVIDLQPGDEKELLMEWNFDRIFDSSTNQTVLERLIVGLKLDHPKESLAAFNVDIHNLGTKRKTLLFESAKKQVQLVCNVFNYKKKKLVRFSSQYIIKNNLVVPIYLQIHEDDGNSTFILIKPNHSASIPIDKIENEFSIHAEKDHKDINYVKFTTSSNKETEISFSNMFAKVKLNDYKAYSCFYVDPLYVIKNCLPFSVNVSLQGKGANSEIFTNPVGTQEELQVLNFSSQSDVSFKLIHDSFNSNEYSMSIIEKQPQELYLMKQDKKVGLDVVIRQNSHLRTYVISARTCVINETMEKLQFYADSGKNPISSPFTIHLKDGTELIIMDYIQTLRVKYSNEGSHLSDPLNITNLGVFNLDLLDSKKKFMNFAVKITSELAGKTN
jgi:hypothetical protein